jgi:hypothetical protein
MKRFSKISLLLFVFLMMPSVQLNAAAQREKKRASVIADVLTSKPFKVALAVGTLVGASLYYASKRKGQLEQFDAGLGHDEHNPEQLEHLLERVIEQAIDEAMPSIMEKMDREAEKMFNGYLLEKEGEILKKLPSSQLKNEFRTYLDNIPHAAPGQPPEMSDQLDNALEGIIDVEGDEFQSYLDETYGEDSDWLECLPCLQQ